MATDKNNKEIMEEHIDINDKMEDIKYEVSDCEECSEQSSLKSSNTDINDIEIHPRPKRKLHSWI